MMKKMVVVPASDVDELRRLRLYQNAKLPPKPEIVQTIDIQKNIDYLMNDPNISNTDKMHRYAEYMLKYNNFKDQAIADAATTVTPPTDIPTKPPTYVPDILKPIPMDNVLTNIPKSMRIPVGNLLEQIKNNTNITWDNKGVVSINGKIIDNSNITDIMNDAARERKSKTNAVGWLDVAEELLNKNQKINVGNKRWSNYVNSNYNKNKRGSDKINTPSKNKRSSKKHKTSKGGYTDDDDYYDNYNDNTITTPIKKSKKDKQRWSNWK